MNNYNVSISNQSLDANVNVHIRVIDRKGRIAQELSKHNKATRNMTEGIIRFLRGEFNTTFLREFKDSLNNIGDNSYIARQFIPTHMGIGNIGIDVNTGKIPEGISKFDIIFEPSYSDSDLRSEILPYYNRSRVKIQKSTKGDSSLSDTYSLSIQGYYQFNQKINSLPTTLNSINDNLVNNDENVFKFIYASSRDYDTPIEVPQFTESGLKCITITELGLYSGDIGDNGSRLLARLLLDAQSPLIVSEDDTVIINWQIGLRSLNDMLMNHDSSDYNYQTTTIAQGLHWNNID